MRRIHPFLGLGLALLASGCALARDSAPVPTVRSVDLNRYMGTWYVIACIPTRAEKQDYNAVETYSLEPDGQVHTVFQYRTGSFDAPLKTLVSTGHVHADTGNAVWGVDVLWLFRAQYKISYLAPDYSAVIVARDARDYAWVMTRTPEVPQAEYAALTAKLQEMGYHRRDVYHVPQSWPERGPGRRIDSSPSPSTER